MSLTTKEILLRVEERYQDIYELAEVLGIDLEEWVDDEDIEGFIRYHRHKIIQSQEVLDIC